MLAAFETDRSPVITVQLHQHSMTEQRGSLQRDFQLSLTCSLAIKVLHCECLRHRVSYYQRPKDILSVTVQQVSEVDQLLFALDRERKVAHAHAFRPQLIAGFRLVALSSDPFSWTTASD